MTSIATSREIDVAPAVDDAHAAFAEPPLQLILSVQKAGPGNRREER